MEVEEAIDAGDQVVVMAPTFAIVWTIEDNEAVRMEAHPTRAVALETVGSSELGREPGEPRA